MELDQIVPWGRCGEEYELMFQLDLADNLGGVLDCGGGPASFTAEQAALGRRVISVDPIYAYTVSEIRRRFEITAEPILAQVKASANDWTWSYHRDPDDLLRTRRRVLDRFLADYEDGARAGRYVCVELPRLPFEAGAFRMALCSHLLFLYSDLLDEAFHLRAVQELCRVAREVRIFPLLTLRRQHSPHIAAVCAAAQAAGWRSEVVTVSYELQRGGNQMLRLVAAP